MSNITIWDFILNIFFVGLSFGVVYVFDIELHWGWTVLIGLGIALIPLAIIKNNKNQ